MKAILYNKKGSPDKLVLCEVEKPIPADDEVLIKVFAVSINAADYRSLKMGLIPKKRIFGADIAGKVESVGNSINQCKCGDEVFGDIADYGFGGLAEYAVAPERLLALKPVKLSFEEAAAVPMASLTALQALRDKGGIQKGQKVLIIGSGGGVGTFAVQLAKYFGAMVTAVCGTNNVALTKSLGADYVIDYTKETFLGSKDRYDIVLAINGNYPFFACRRILNPDGRYVMIGGAFTQIFKALLFGWAASFGSKKMHFLAAKTNHQDLSFLAKLVDEGALKPVIDRRYPLEKAADAMGYISTGHARGKVVVEVEKPEI